MGVLPIVEILMASCQGRGIEEEIDCLDDVGMTYLWLFLAGKVELIPSYHS
jgi:hypothetical protein